MTPYLVGTTPYTRGQPCANQDLIRLYGLNDLANSVARTDPVTGEKRKLRKSYKNQMADLSGKHTIPVGRNGSWSLLELARMPDRYDPNAPQAPSLLQNRDQPFDARELSAALSLDRTPATGVPDFDVALLAVGVSDAQLGPEEHGNYNGSGTGDPFVPTKIRLTGAITGESSNDDGPSRGMGNKKSRKMKRRDKVPESEAKRRKV